MSVTASPALITASCAAATNDRPAGNRRNSDVCDKNTRRGGSSPAMTHSIPALTHREDTNSRRKTAREQDNWTALELFGEPTSPAQGRRAVRDDSPHRG